MSVHSTGRRYVHLSNLTARNVSQFIVFTARATDADGNEVTCQYTLQVEGMYIYLNLTARNVSQFIVFTVQATDADGNEATCQYMLQVEGMYIYLTSPHGMSVSSSCSPPELLTLMGMRRRVSTLYRWKVCTSI